MEKYEALYHYFSYIKPNFGSSPQYLISLYLKLQKFTHFKLFGHIVYIFYRYNGHHYSLVLVAACNILTTNSVIQISHNSKSSIKFQKHEVTKFYFSKMKLCCLNSPVIPGDLCYLASDTIKQAAHFMHGNHHKNVI